jgi:flagellar biosynthetic protein FliR
MSLESALEFIPAYVLVFFRVAGMMVMAPLLGSARVPKRVKAILAAVIAMGIARGITTHVTLPTTLWGLTIGIGGEMVFGLCMGMILSFIFIAVQWAGEMVGQQMGLNMSEVFDPQFGQRGSLIGDMYFWAATAIFLLINGHHAMLIGMNESFTSLPLLSVGMNKDLFDLMVGLLHATTTLAIQLSAPMLVTMLIVDVALGFVGKTVPQLNLMTAGLPLRALVGMVVLIIGIGMASDVIRGAIFDSMDTVRAAWHAHFVL